MPAKELIRLREITGARRPQRKRPGISAGPAPRRADQGLHVNAYRWHTKAKCEVSA